MNIGIITPNQANYINCPNKQYISFGAKAPSVDTLEISSVNKNTSFLSGALNLLHLFFNTNTSSDNSRGVNIPSRIKVTQDMPVEEYETNNGTVHYVVNRIQDSEEKEIRVLYDAKTGKKLLVPPTEEELIKECGINEYYVKILEKNPCLFFDYEDYLQQGYSKKVAANTILMNFYYPYNRHNFFDIADVAPIIESVSRFDEMGASADSLCRFFQNDSKSDIAEFAQYIQQIDFDKLTEEAPEMLRFGVSEVLKFLSFNKQKGNVTFDREMLTFSKDLTSHFKNRPVGASELNTLLIRYPATSRIVGELPDGWLGDNSEEKQVLEDVSSAISHFQESKNKEEFEENLSNILGKTVSVEKLGFGTFGTGYKISGEGMKTVCLKVFDRNLWDEQDIHGQHIEVQMGLFANNHSNDYVKMYFGKVAAHCDRDGFLVTEYLSSDTEPSSTNPEDTQTYEIKPFDTTDGRNMINGKIIDFGAVGALKRK